MTDLQPPKYKVTQQALADFSATVKAKPDLTKEDLFKKFPEFNNDEGLLQAAMDYHATVESGKYKDLNELNSKFPEFEFVEDSKKKVDGSKPSTIGLGSSPAASYRETASDINKRYQEIDDLSKKAEKLAIGLDAWEPKTDAEKQEYNAMVKDYNAIVKELEPMQKQLQTLLPIAEKQRDEYLKDNVKKQDDLFKALGLSPEEISKVRKDVFKAQHPDKAEQVDKGLFIPTSIDVDADDLAQALTGGTYETAKSKAEVRDNRSVTNRIFGSFGKSVEKVLAFQMPASAGAALATSLSYIKKKGDQATNRDPIIAAIDMVAPGIKRNVDSWITDAQAGLFQWSKGWQEADQHTIPGGVMTFRNDKELIQSLAQIKKPLDVIDFVFSSAGQGIAQIIPSILTRGATSYVQEIGQNYIDGVVSIAQAKTKELGREVTPEEVIRQNWDAPEIALQYGIVQGAMEKLAADKIWKGIGFGNFEKDIKQRGLKWFQAAKEAGKTEFITESLQSASNQIAVQRMTGLGRIDAVKKLDWFQILDEGVAGAIGGSSMAMGGSATKAAADKLAYFSELNKKSKETLTEGEKTALENYLNEVVDIAIKKGDPRSPEQITKFVREEVLPKIRVKKPNIVPEVDVTKIKADKEQTFKTITGEEVTGKRIEIPGLERLDFAVVKDPEKPMMYNVMEVHTGAVANKDAAMSEKEAIEVFWGKFAGKTISQDKMLEKLYDASKDETVKGINKANESPKIQAWIKTNQAEQDALPDLYTPDEKKDFEKLLVEVKKDGNTQLAEDIEKDMNRKFNKSNLSWRKPAQSYRDRHEFWVEDKKRNEVIAKKEPLPDDLRNPNYREQNENQTTGDVVNSEKRDYSKRFLSRIGLRKSEFDAAVQAAAKINNKYGYVVVGIGPELSGLAIKRDENVTPEQIEEAKNVYESLKADIEKYGKPVGVEFKIPNPTPEEIAEEEKDIEKTPAEVNAEILRAAGDQVGRYQHLPDGLKLVSTKRDYKQTYTLTSIDSLKVFIGDKDGKPLPLTGDEVDANFGEEIKRLNNNQSPKGNEEDLQQEQTREAEIKTEKRRRKEAIDNAKDNLSKGVFSGKSYKDAVKRAKHSYKINVAAINKKYGYVEPAAKSKYDVIEDSTPEIIIAKFFAERGMVNMKEAMERTGYSAPELIGRVKKTGTRYHTLFERVVELIDVEDDKQLDDYDIYEIIDTYVMRKADPYKYLNQLLPEALEGNEIFGDENFTPSDEQVEAEIEIDAENVPKEFRSGLDIVSGELMSNSLTEAELKTIKDVMAPYTDAEGNVDWKSLLQHLDEDRLSDDVLQLTQKAYDSLEERAKQEAANQKQPEENQREGERGNVPPLGAGQEQQGEKVEPPKSIEEAESNLKAKQKQLQSLENDLAKAQAQLDKNLNENQIDMFGQNKPQDMFNDKAEQQDRVNKKRKDVERVREEVKAAIDEVERQKAKNPKQLDFIMPKEAGEEYRYMLTSRPFGIGTYPKENFVRHEPGGKYGYVIYSKPVPTADWTRFELTPETELREATEGKLYEDENWGKIEATPAASGTPFVTVKLSEPKEGDPNFTDEITLSAKEFFVNLETGYFKPRAEKKKATPPQAPTPKEESFPTFEELIQPGNVINLKAQDFDGRATVKSITHESKSANGGYYDISFIRDDGRLFRMQVLPDQTKNWFVLYQNPKQAEQAPSPPKGPVQSTKTKSKLEALDKKISSDIDDILGKMGDLLGDVSNIQKMVNEEPGKYKPVSVELLTLGTTLVGKYVELGVVRFAKIADDILTRLGEDRFRLYFRAIKSAYNSMYADVDGLDDPKSIREITADDIINAQGKEEEIQGSDAKGVPHPYVNVFLEAYNRGEDKWTAEYNLKDTVLNLGGDQYKDLRQQIISGLRGQQVPKANSGVTAIYNEMLKYIEVNGLTKPEKKNDTATADRVERDRQRNTPNEQVGQENVSKDGTANQNGTTTTEGTNAESGNTGQGNNQFSDLLPPPSSEPTDPEMGEREAEQGGVLERVGRGSNPAGPSDTGDTGVQPEPNTEDDTEEDSVESTATRLDLNEKKRLQLIADKNIKVEPKNPDNIRATLPVLIPHQHENVRKAEERFFTEPKPGDVNKGIMFTDATGTGKTFTGLGIVKRFDRMGLRKVLIVVPTDAKVKDWIVDAEFFDMKFKALTGVKDQGGREDKVITTYANFRQNEALLKRAQEDGFDLVIYDEAHKLISNLQGSATAADEFHKKITMSPDNAERYIRDRFEPQLTKELKEAGYISDTTKKAIAAETKRITDRTKVIFLSASPFSYHKNLTYADGYLFTIKEGQRDKTAAHNDFFVRNFGYRIRYHKLTEPEAGVDVSLMERNFHSGLMKSGALSSTRLVLDKDYSRDFVLVDSKLGLDIDEGIKIGEERKWPDGTDKKYLPDIIRKKFRWAYKNQLMEGIKSKKAIERAKQHLALGRKVVIFHTYVNSIPEHPFDLSNPELLPMDAGPQAVRMAQAEIDRFHKENPQYRQLDLSDLSNPIETFKKAFGNDVLVFNGTIPKGKRRDYMRQFNDDTSGKNIIVIQMEAGKEGISLHDTSGKMPRIMMDLGMPYKPTDSIQMEGRIYRYGLASNAMLEYMVLHLNFEKNAFASKINDRVKTAENLAFGEEARNLEVTFKEGYKNPTQEPPNLNQGVGGRDADGNFEKMDEFDKAITYYIARGKRNAKTKAREGVDYYATPEPIGLKMVQWLYPKANDKLLEPSAGHGAIARFMPENTNNKFVEPSYELRADLAINSMGDVVASTFEDFHLVNKADGIAMNPPYGSSGKTAMEHVEKALRHLNDGGRLIAIVPDGPSMSKRLDQFWESDNSEGFYPIAEISLPTVAFERAGTSVKTKIIIIDKQESEASAKKLPMQKFIDLSSAETYQELFDRIRNLEMPAKVEASSRTVEDIMKKINTRPETEGKPVELIHTVHTRDKYEISVVKLNKRVDTNDYNKFNAKAKELGGYYSSFKGNGAIPGFIFRNKVNAGDFFLYVDNFFKGLSADSDDIDDAGVSNMVSEPYSSKGKAPISAHEIRPVNGSGEPFTIYKKVIDLAAKYNPDSTLGQGHLSRGALGTFYTQSHNVRLVGLNSLAVALHELTHALDARFEVIQNFIKNTGSGDALRKQLTEVYVRYYPKAKASHSLRMRMVEGYATLVQKFIEQPTEIKNDFPDLVKEFMTPGGKYYFDEMGQFLSDAEEVIVEYQTLDPLSKMGTRIVNERIDEPDSFLTPDQKITQQIFDRLYPIEVLAKRNGTHFTTDDVSTWMRLGNNALQIAEKNISSKRNEYWQMDANGEWQKKHDFNYQTIVKLLDARDLQKEFASWLFGRRIHFEYVKLRKLESKLAVVSDPLYVNFIMQQKQTDQVTAEKIVQGMIDELNLAIADLTGILEREEVGESEARNAYNAGKDVFQKEAQMFDTLVNEDLNLAHNPTVQLLDDEGFQAMNDKEGYSPFHRQQYDELVGGEQLNVPQVGANKISQFMKRRGSSKPVLNPLISAMQNHAEVVRKSMKQMVYNKFIPLAEANPDLFQIQQLKVNPDDKSNRYPQERHPDFIMARKGYHRIPILVNAEIKAVLDENFGYHNVNMLERLGIDMAQTFRTGTTGIFWQFFINNIFLDQAAASINTRNGMIPFVSMFRYGLPAALSVATEKISQRVFGRAMMFPLSKEAAYLKEYLFLAGSSQTFLSADVTSRKAMEDIVMGLDKGWSKRLHHYFQLILRIASTPGNASEILTRGTEFIMARMNGKPQVVALEEAGRVSAPFHHMGSLKFGEKHNAAAYIRSVPYFNASLQVFKQVKDSLNTPTGRKRYAFAALSMMAASVSSVLYLLGQDDDDEQKQLLKSIPPETMTKFLFLPNPYSSKRLLQIRVPEQIGFMAGLMNMMLIEQAGQTSYKWSEYGQAATSFMPQQVNPFGGYQTIFSWFPQAIKPGLEVAFNKKTYPTVRPIETFDDQLKNAEYRFNRYTSPAAKFLGEKLSLSPKMIDHFLEGTFGRSIKYVTGKEGSYGVEDIFTRELYFEASRQVQFYYDTKERNAQNIEAYMNGRRAFTEEEVNKLFEIEDAVLEVESVMQDYKSYMDEDSEIQANYSRNEAFKRIRDLEKLIYF